MTNKVVYVVGGTAACQYSQMFAEQDGYETTPDIKRADILCFTGGADVDPALYGEKMHPASNTSPLRDKHEIDLYRKWRSEKAMVGICRGGQLLNVLNGGTMYQHVDRHGVGAGHKATDTETGEEVQVTSTHHQMMRPNLGTGKILLKAKESTFKEFVSPSSGKKVRIMGDEEDVECVLYEDTKTLCFQPHPEFPSGKGGCRDYFFKQLKRIT